MKIFLYIFYCFVISTTVANSETKFKIRYFVNNEIITNYDVIQRLSLLKLLRANNKISQETVTQELIREEIKKQYAKQIGISASKTEVQNLASEKLSDLGVNKKTFTEALQNNKIDNETFTTFLTSQIIWKKTIVKMYTKDSNISADEITRVLPVTPRLKDIELNISEIIIPFSERGKENTIILGKQLLTDLSKTDNFSLAAKRFSRAPSSQNGGEIGFIKSQNLPEKIKSSFQKISENELSELVILDNSIMILKINKINNLSKSYNAKYKVRYFLTPIELGIDKNACSSNSDKIIERSLFNLPDILFIPLSRLIAGDSTRINYNGPKILTLCKRSLDLNENDLFTLKNEKFNHKMNLAANKLMTELLRNASIRKNEN